jgi:hypothetical protein
MALCCAPRSQNMRRLDSIRAEGEDEDDVRQLIHRLVPAKKRPVELMMYKISTSPLLSYRSPFVYSHRSVGILHGFDGINGPRGGV